MLQHYPRAAKSARMGGRAVLFCTVGADGKLTNCKVDGAYPHDKGFDQAALEMAPLFRLRPKSLDGRATAGGTVRIPIVFHAVGFPMDGLSSALLCYGQAAAVAERDPADAKSWEAARFWAVQAIADAADAHSTPSGIEGDISASRIAAAATVGTADGAAKLNTCDRAMKSVERAP